MTGGRPSSLLLGFSLPLVLGNLFQQLYTFVDTLIVGQKLGVKALAALGATEWLCFLMFGFIQGVTQGLSIHVAKYFGQGDRKLTQQAFFQAIGGSAVMSALFLGIGQGMISPALALLRTPAELSDLSCLYLRILYLGIPISFAYNILAALLRAFGNSRAPLQAMVLASFCNIILDVVFVIGFSMGIHGAAFATLAAQLCSVVYCAAALHRIEQAKVEHENRVWNRKMLSEQMKLAVPMGLQNIITAAGGLVVQSVANGFGILFLAGYTAANKLYGLLETAASSYGYGISTYTAQNLGAGKKERIRAGMIAALGIGTVTACLMSAVMLFFGKPILRLFITDRQIEIEEAIRLGYQYLCILAFFFPLLYALYILRSCIQGMGHSVMPMLSSMIQVFMRIACAVMVTRFLGNAGIFWGEIMAWMGADLFLMAVLVRQYRRIRV